MLFRLHLMHLKSAGPSGVVDALVDGFCSEHSATLFSILRSPSGYWQQTTYSLGGEALWLLWRGL